MSEERKNKYKKIVDEFGNRPSKVGSQISLRLTTNRPTSFGTPPLFRKGTSRVVEDDMRNNIRTTMDEYFLSNPSKDDLDDFHVFGKRHKKDKPLFLALNDDNYLEKATRMESPQEFIEFINAADLFSAPLDHIEAMRSHYQELLKDADNQIKYAKKALDQTFDLTPLFAKNPDLLKKDGEWIVKYKGQTVTDKDFKNKGKAKELLPVVLDDVVIRSNLDHHIRNYENDTEILLKDLLGEKLNVDDQHHRLLGTKHHIDSIKHNLDNIYQSRIALAATENAILEQRDPDYYALVKRRLEEEIDDFVEKEDLLGDLMGVGLGVMYDFGVVNDIDQVITNLREDLSSATSLKQKFSDYLSHNLTKWKKALENPNEAADAGFGDVMEEAINQFLFWSVAEVFREKELERMLALKTSVQKPANNQALGYQLDEKQQEALENADMLLFGASLQEEDMLVNHLKRVKKDTEAKWTEYVLNSGPDGWENAENGAIKKYDTIITERGLNTLTKDNIDVMADEEKALLADFYNTSIMRGNTLKEYREVWLPKIINMWTSGELKIFETDKKPGLFRRIANALTGKKDHNTFILSQIRRIDDMLELTDDVIEQGLNKSLNDPAFADKNFDAFINNYMQRLEKELEKEPRSESYASMQARELRETKKMQEEYYEEKAEQKFAKAFKKDFEKELKKTLNEMHEIQRGNRTRQKKYPSDDLKRFLDDDFKVSTFIDPNVQLELLATADETKDLFRKVAIPDNPRQPYIYVPKNSDAIDIKVDYDEISELPKVEVSLSEGWRKIGDKLIFDDRDILHPNYRKLPGWGLGKNKKDRYEVDQYVFLKEGGGIEIPKLNNQELMRWEKDNLGKDRLALSGAPYKYFTWFRDNYSKLAEQKAKRGTGPVYVPAAMLLADNLIDKPEFLESQNIAIDWDTPPGPNFDHGLRNHLSDLGKKHADVEKFGEYDNPDETKKVIREIMASQRTGHSATRSFGGNEYDETVQESQGQGDNLWSGNRGDVRIKTGNKDPTKAYHDLGDTRS